MLKNYIKIAFRNLKKNKLHSFINIFGLSLGIAVAILIFLFIQNEVSYDRWQADEGKIYRVYRYWENDREKGWVWSPPPMVDLLESEVPEVLNATGLIGETDRLLDYEGKKIYAPKAAQVDSTFFQTIPLPFLYGNADLALQTPEAIVISEKMARRLFGEENPIGKIVKMEGEDNYQIAGVLAETTKTHLDYDVISVMTWQNDNWTANQNATYVRIVDGANVVAVEQKIASLVNPRIAKAFEDNGQTYDKSQMSKWGLQPIEEVYLHSRNFTWNGDKRGDIQYVFIFGFIALIVLLVAVINYTNLGTARVALRAKEVGVRKVSGAERRHLITQFLTESVVQSLLALLVAMMLAEFMLPLFNSLTDRALLFVETGFSGLLLPLLGIGFFIGILAGIYPAFVLSGFEPIKVLKGVFGNKGASLSLRKMLVIGQFSISIALIIVMSFIFKQVNFMLDQDLGFDSEQVMVVPLNLWNSKYRVMNLENTIKDIEGIETLALSSMMPGEQFSQYTVKVEGHQDPVGTMLLNVTSGFEETLGLEVLEGRFLDEKQYGQDTINNFVVNESFVKKHNLTNPVGKQMGFVFDEQPGRIVGVVKDFHQAGLQSEIKPLAMVARSFLMTTSMKVSTQNLKKTVQDLEHIWTQIEPEHPMRYSFLDANFATQYAEQERFGKAMLYATIFTIFIAILGLFGLASFAAERRTKEIGIRKILGATGTNLVNLLVKDFVLLVVIASLIAMPIGYYFAKSWLADFAYQTDITAFPFIIAMFLTLVLTIFTVGYQAVKTASRNPVEALRYE